MKTNIYKITNRILNHTDAFPKMRKDSNYMNWSEDLAHFAISDKIPTIGPILINDKTRLFEDDYLRQFQLVVAKNIPKDEFCEMSIIARENLKKNPYSSAVMSFFALLGWVENAGNQLYNHDYNGMPYVGWELVPYVLALSCNAIGACIEAKILIEHSYDIMMAAKYIMDPNFKTYIKQYVQLLDKVNESYNNELSNFVDDLRNSCKKAEHDFCAEIGALLWTLGKIPESFLFKSSDKDNSSLSRSLFKRIIVESVYCINHDPLLQYIWLEMKDRPPFNIRDHKSFFNLFNTVYYNNFIDDLFVYETFSNQLPSRMYAKTLIKWFKGTLQKDEVAAYISLCSSIEMFFNSGQVDWSIFMRMTILGYLLIIEFGFTDYFNKELLDKMYYHLIAMAVSVKENLNLYFDRPEIFCRLNIPYYFLVEKELSKTKSSESNINKVISSVENFRTSTLSYWLIANPPIFSEEASEKMKLLLEEEVKVLKDIRGAYFLILYPLLSHNYDYYSYDLDSFLAKKSATDPSKLNLTPDNGRSQYKKLLENLNNIWTQISEISPTYAAKRISPQPDIGEIINAIAKHSNS